MENKCFYVKYLDNQSVKVETHFIGDQDRRRPLADVADLIAAFFPDTPLNELGQYSLHLPDGIDRTCLSQDCFSSNDENDTGLDVGCLLSELGSISTKSKQPFIIRSNQEYETRESKAKYWRVSGTISNYIAVKGVRSRMYRNADNHLGYYESGQPAFFYGESGTESETTLSINVLFKTEESALHFDSHLRNESITIHSPMNKLAIHSVVSPASGAQLGERIYYKDYIPTESESPQDTQSVITIQFSTFEQTSDEFKYQRIEKLSVFGSLGKAESCHLMSASNCRKYPSFNEYDKDPNNRLAMSRDLHGWFANLNTAIPLFYLKLVSISESVIVEDRYRVEIAVVAFNQESADMIFCRLIEGSTQTNDPLVMHTSVFVAKPIIFKECLEWKENETKKKWEDYCSMVSAVP